MIHLEKLSIVQGDFELRDINLVVPEREYITLMGATGCGKTTLLEAICGLRMIKSGRIIVGNRDISMLASAQRGIGYVPQDHALFPLMRIEDQIQFGLVARRVKSKARKKRTDELAELLGIQHLIRTYPQGLSGGEKQRVALARALSFRPRLLCLDEPLSALDDTTRNSITDLLKSIYESEDVTILHITHNMEEAKKLGTSHFRFIDGQIFPFEQ